MKKHIFILFLFLITTVHVCFSQENLAVILDNLSVKKKAAQTNIIKTDRSDYFDLMKKNQSFYYSSENKTCIHISSYKNFSAYLVIHNMILSQEDYTDWLKGDDENWDFSLLKERQMVLLFDREKSFCYLIKYGLENKFFYFEYPYNNSIIFTANLKDGGVSLIRLGETLKPLYGANIGIVVGKKEGETNSIYKFKYYSNSVKKDNLYKKQIVIPTTNIYELSIDELATLFSENSESVGNINVETPLLQLDQTLFDASISGF